MAHVTLLNFAGSSLIPDNSPITAGDKPCGIKFLKDRGVAVFDDTDEEAALTPPMSMPGQYAGGTLMATLKVIFASEITVTDEAVFDVAVEAVTPGDALDLDAGRGFDALNTANEVDPPGTAGHQTSFDDTLANKDSVAAGDEVSFLVRRDTDHANDTCTGDVYISSIEIWEST